MSWEQELQMGQVALSKQEIEIAEKRFRSALASTQAEFWYPVPEIAEIQSLLAEALLLRGCYAEAKQFFEQSEDFFGSAEYAVDSFRRSINWYGLAEIIQQEKDQERALKLFKDAVPFLKHSSDHRHLFYERACAFISGVEEKPLLPWEMTETAKSKEMKQISEAISVAFDTPESEIEKARNWEQLLHQVTDCTQVGTPEKALEAYLLARKTLALAKTLFPLKHAASALTISQVASALGALRMFEEAAEHYRFAIEILQELFGVDSIEVAMMRMNLAHLFRKAEMYPDAHFQFCNAAANLVENEEVDQEQFQRHCELFLQMQAAWKCSSQVKELVRHAKEMEAAEKYSEAIQALFKAMKALAKYFPATHSLSLLVKDSLHQIYANLGWDEEVEALAKEISSLKASIEAEEKRWKDIISSLDQEAVLRQAA